MHGFGKAGHGSTSLLLLIAKTSHLCLASRLIRYRCESEEEEEKSGFRRKKLGSFCSRNYRLGNFEQTYNTTYFLPQLNKLLLDAPRRRRGTKDADLPTSAELMFIGPRIILLVE